MPSSYRFDKQRKTEWTEAVKAGDEEQLRIRKAVAKR
jgi:NADH-quinone oxidoreductase subunit B